MMICVSLDGFMATSPTYRTKNYTVIGVEHCKASQSRDGKLIPSGVYPIVRPMGSHAPGTTVRTGYVLKIIKPKHPGYLEMMSYNLTY